MKCIGTRFFYERRRFSNGTWCYGFGGGGSSADIVVDYSVPGSVIAQKWHIQIGRTRLGEGHPSLTPH